MADELNVPTHRYYKPKYNVALAKEDISPKYILDSGIRKIDARIGEVEIREPLFSNSEAGVWYDPSQAANLDWRRNLLTFTEQFDKVPWYTGSATITANSAAAPDGTMTADKFVPNASATGATVAQTSSTIFAATSYNFSFYAKASEQSLISLVSNLTGAFRANVFNLAAETATSGIDWTASIVSVGNGWYRCSCSATADIAATRSFQISNNTTGWVGDGTSGLFLWGAQLELGSTATEYQRITDVNTEVMERFPEATLFQDTAGTIPVTTAGQTVGLMLDKSKGLVLGPELVTNGDFGTGDLTGWTNASFGTGTAVYNSGGVDLTRVDVNNEGQTRQAITTIAGSTYEVRYDRTSGTNGRLWVGTGDTGTARLNLGEFIPTGTNNRATFRATGSTTYLLFNVGANGVTVRFDNISVKELAGNHATQATAASRPTYGIVPFGGRRNLLTFSEQFENAIWVKNGVVLNDNQEQGPFSGSLADHIQGTGSLNLIQQNLTGIAQNTNVTLSFYFKPVASGYVGVRLALTSYDNITRRCGFNTSTGELLENSSSVDPVAVSVGDGWFRASATFPTNSGAAVPVFRIYGTDGEGNPFTLLVGQKLAIFGAQAEAGSTPTAYQRVTTQYDVTEAGVPPVAYLAFDGVDDGMVTPTITPSIDKVQVFAGVRKLSDAAVGMISEYSADTNTNNGSWYLLAPTSAGVANSGFLSKGTIASGSSAANFAAPISAVITGIGDISGDTSRQRRNGTQVSQSTADQGTGNYLAYPLYIGRRGGTSLPFNGQLYSLVTRFGSNLEANDIANTETYVASKTGVTL